MSPIAMPRVLVADDQPDILQALRLLLGDAGFDTELVPSVEAVVRRVQAQPAPPVDLLLMDLNYTRDTTSGREGLDLLTRVRSHDPALPVVVMTGWGTIETAVEAMRRGARSFVQKPWDDATLVEVVRRELDEAAAVRREDARVARERDEARLIQQALLPSVLPALEGCRIAARWTPAAGLGGDCYDAIRFAPAVAAVSIADVAGKGLPAALLMSNLQAAVRAFAAPAVDPHEVTSRVNRLLCRNIAPGRFVTFCYVVIDTVARELRYANAGHFPPLVVRATGEVDRLNPTGLVLGVASDWHYSTGVAAFHPGDRLVCYTDGVTEAQSIDGREFGDDQLLELVRAFRAEPPAALAQAIMDAVAAWTATGPQDDATLVIVAAD
jgi:sigma-B regulation protein RsbU (phosphoserine phosphatase)